MRPSYCCCDARRLPICTWNRAAMAEHCCLAAWEQRGLGPRTATTATSIVSSSADADQWTDISDVGVCLRRKWPARGQMVLVAALSRDCRMLLRRSRDRCRRHSALADAARFPASSASGPRRPSVRSGASRRNFRRARRPVSRSRKSQTHAQLWPPNQRSDRRSSAQSAACGDGLCLRERTDYE